MLTWVAPGMYGADMATNAPPGIASLCGGFARGGRDMSPPLPINGLQVVLGGMKNQRVMGWGELWGWGRCLLKKMFF